MPKVVDVEERRQRLAAAAARVIARSGVGGATVREVASEAGVTSGALTHYFTDKRELLVFTLRASLERRRADAPLPTEADALARLRALLARALPTTTEARLHWLVTLAFCAEAAGDTAMAAEQRDAYRGFRAAVVALLDEAAEVGLLTGPTDTQAAADHLIAVTDGVALQALFDPDAWPPERQWRQVDAGIEALLGRGH